MASISDTIFISLGLKTADFSKSMDKAKDNVKKTSSELAKGADQVAGKAIGQLAGIARMVAAPLAGAMSIGSMIKSYFGGVAQVAQMTGAYSPKLDEWRKKRALLNRVTQEDIQLYKKSREALTKFQITMADLSAKIMRQTSPAVKFLAEMLTKVSDWVDAHSDDIVRFITIVASLIGTALIPRLLKMAAAMALNPITWIVAALIGLAAVIDDLIVWLEGGESALGDFWSMFGSREEVLEKIQKAIKWVTETLKELWEIIKTGIKAAITWLDEFWTACSGTDRVLDALREAFESVMQTMEDLGVIWDYLVELFKDNGFLDDLADALDGTLTFITGLFREFFAGLQAIFGLIKGLLTGDWGSFNAAVEKAIDAAKDAFKGLWKVVKAIFSQIWELAKDIFSMIGDAIKNVLRAAFAAVMQTIEGIGQAFEGAIDFIIGLFNGFFAAVMQTIEDIGQAFEGALDFIIGLFNGFFNAVMQTIEDMGQAFEGALDFIIGLFNGFFSGLQAIMGLIKDLLTGDWESFNQAVDKAIDAAKGAFEGLWKAVKAILNQIWEFAKDIFRMIGDAIKNALSIDVDKWTQKLNPMNWFKSDAPVASEQPDKWTQKLNPMNWFKSDAPEVMNEGLQAERSTAGMLADNRSTTIDSHANVTINTNSPAVAQAAVEQAAPGSSSGYVDQSALALS